MNGAATAVLDERGCRKIHEAALTLLEETGCAVLDPEALASTAGSPSPTWRSSSGRRPPTV